MFPHLQPADQDRFIADIPYQARSHFDSLGIITCDRHADAPTRGHGEMQTCEKEQRRELPYRASQY
jgi:hypothetical protein